MENLASFFKRNVNEFYNDVDDEEEENASFLATLTTQRQMRLPAKKNWSCKTKINFDSYELVTLKFVSDGSCLWLVLVACNVRPFVLGY